MREFNFRPDEDRSLKSRENLFLDHYSWLMSRAVQMTRGQRARAEDLVQDVFVQFLAREIDPDLTGEMRWYLHGILKKLHLLQLRRAMRQPLEELSPLDFDTAATGLRADDYIDRNHTLRLLAGACEYCCARKNVSLTSGALILRFFHGYYQNEIALLLGAKRRTVNQWILRGRAEAKEYAGEYLERPRSSSWGAIAAWSVPAGSSSAVFLRTLRQRIFQSCDSPCPSPELDWTEYGSREVGHLVSCQACLDQRSRRVGLAGVHDRFPDDIADGDGGPSAPSGGEGGDGVTARKREARSFLRLARARRRDLLEHHPREISLIFDGQTHAALLVNGKTNVLNVSIEAGSLPQTVAVLSEQEFQFLMLDRRDLDPAEPKHYHLCLSEGRSLDVAVTPEAIGVSVRVAYVDPGFIPIEAQAATAVSSYSSDGSIVSIFRESSRQALPARPSPARRWLDSLRNLFPLTLNPLLAGTLLFGLAALLCVALWMRSKASRPTAQALLEPAQGEEHRAASTALPGVVLQRVSIRTGKRSIERRLPRDAQGRRKPKLQQLSREEEALSAELAGAGVDWNLPLSAAGFMEWRSQAGKSAESVTRAGEHLWTITTVPEASPHVLRESLTLRDTDFHSVDRTVTLREEGTIEIAELSYETMPWTSATEDWFEPERRDRISDAPRRNPSRALNRPILDAGALDVTELSARLALHELGADRGEQIEVFRQPGAVLVKGIVDTKARAEEIKLRLRTIPYVEAAVSSFNEAQEAGDFSVPDSTHIQAGSMVAEPSPLEIGLVAQGKPREEAWRLARDLMEDAVTASRAAGKLADIRRFFDREENLPITAKPSLLLLARDYEREVSSALDREERLLREAGIAQSASAPWASPAGSSSSPPLSPARQNLTLCRELTRTSTPASRPSAAIVAEIERSLAQARSSADLHPLGPDTGGPVVNAAPLSPTQK